MVNYSFPAEVVIASVFFVFYDRIRQIFLMTFDIVWGVYIEVGLLCPKNKGHAVSFGYSCLLQN